MLPASPQRWYQLVPFVCKLHYLIRERNRISLPQPPSDGATLPSPSHSFNYLCLQNLWQSLHPAELLFRLQTPGFALAHQVLDGGKCFVPAGEGPSGVCSLLGSGVWSQEGRSNLLRVRNSSQEGFLGDCWKQAHSHLSCCTTTPTSGSLKGL